MSGYKFSYFRFSVSHHSPVTPLYFKASLKALIACCLSLSSNKSVYLRIGYVLFRSMSSFVDILPSLSPFPSSVFNSLSAFCPSLLEINVAWLSSRSPKNFTSLGPAPTKVRKDTVNPPKRQRVLAGDFNLLNIH